VRGLHNLTAELKTFSIRLSHLVHIGCRPYELVEYPKILLLSESEIDARVEKLHRASSVSGISIALLKHVTPETPDSVVNRRVLRYLQPLNGRLNKVDEIVQELNCSDTKMMEILTRNPRLLGVYHRKDVAEKIRCLISYGACHDDLYRNTNLLNNKTLATIQSRAERLRKIGLIPLPLGLLDREGATFETVVGKLEAQQSFVDRNKVGNTDDVINLLPPMSANRIAVIRPRIEYLLCEGYMVSDIVNCPQSVKFSLEKLKMAVSELKPYHLQCVDLAVVCHYAAKRRILSLRRSHIRTIIAHAIGCSRSALPPLPKDNSVHNAKDVHRTAATNVKYLCDELGFTTNDLTAVPLVITHAPNIVRRHWNTLDSADDSQAELPCISQQARSLFHQHADDRRLRLNLLQYCIEKEANFSHACMSTWTEDSDDDFRVTETLSPSADGSSVTLHDDSTDEGVVYDKLNVQSFPMMPDDLDESDHSDIDNVDPLL